MRMTAGSAAIQPATFGPGLQAPGLSACREQPIATQPLSLTLALDAHAKIVIVSFKMT